jgi:hypothetical protein
MGAHRMHKCSNLKLKKVNKIKNIPYGINYSHPKRYYSTAVHGNAVLKLH